MAIFFSAALPGSRMSSGSIDPTTWSMRTGPSETIALDDLKLEHGTFTVEVS